MALIKCVECSGKVSDRAESCPHCGCPVEAWVVQPLPIVAKALPSRPAQSPSPPSRPAMTQTPPRVQATPLPAVQPSAVTPPPSPIDASQQRWQIVKGVFALVAIALFFGLDPLITWFYKDAPPLCR